MKTMMADLSRDQIHFTLLNIDLHCLLETQTRYIVLQNTAYYWMTSVFIRYKCPNSIMQYIKRDVRQLRSLVLLDSFFHFDYLCIF